MTVMSMKLEHISKRLKEAREKNGLSQEALAKLMGWKSHTSLVAIEQGGQDIKTWELLKFAQILKVSPESLYSEVSLCEDKFIVFWRQKPSSEKTVSKEERNILQNCLDYRLLERLVGNKSPAYTKLPTETFDIENVDKDWVQRLAEKIYKEMQLGSYPAELLIKCLEEVYGVLYLSRNLEEGSAACHRGENGIAILLNEKEIYWRKIFNLAHELFHLITWDITLINKVQSNKKLFKKNEKLADEFAASLLMPIQMIYGDVQGQKLTYSLIVALARKYSVSTHALLLRLVKLKFISEAEFNKILNDSDFKEIDKQSSKAALQSNRLFDNRFVRLGYLALESGKISKSRLAQMFGIKLPDIDTYLSDKGFYLTNDKEIKSTC